MCPELVVRNSYILHGSREVITFLVSKEFRRLKTYGVSGKKKIEVVAMENEDSSVRRWEDLDIKILVMIFLSFGLF